VRHHGPVRIEVEVSDFPLLEYRGDRPQAAAGRVYIVSLDLAGYSLGSLNQVGTAADGLSWLSILKDVVMAPDPGRSLSI
jgi:hypothetical protein